MYRRTAAILFTALPFLALIPLMGLTVEWLQLPEEIGLIGEDNVRRGFDWVDWKDSESGITASYVFPKGPARLGGLEAGDVLFQLDGQQFFQAEDLKDIVAGTVPGSERTYTVQRNEELLSLNVRAGGYPTFIYPLSTILWYGSLWGFTAGAFIHLLALIIAVPLAGRSRRAGLSALLILASALWVGGNLVRMVLIQVAGPPDVFPSYSGTFRWLTLLSLTGWIAFPVLMLRRAAEDLELPQSPLAVWRLLIWLPAVVLLVGVWTATTNGSFGPFGVDDLIGPVLFYVCVYVASAGVVTFLRTGSPLPDAADRASQGYRIGLLLLSVAAVVGSVAVLLIIRDELLFTDTLAGWIVVVLQLISVAPVVLISFATLRYGTVHRVLTRSIAYLTVAGLFFFLFVGALYLISPYMGRLDLSRNVVAGLVGVATLVLLERTARYLRPWTSKFFVSDRQRSRQDLSLLTDRMRNSTDTKALARTVVETVGRSLDARSGALFLRHESDPDNWIEEQYHPEPPFITTATLASTWSAFEARRGVWALNSEFDDSGLPEDLSDLLRRHGVTLAIPIVGERFAYGVLLLGARKRTRALYSTVYNIEDVDLLRIVAGQLAIAMERLDLVAREKELVKINAEASMAALRAQINPHFLFNALNTIASLIQEKPDQAEKAVEHLAAIFRHVLKTSGSPFVTVEREISLVDNYLSIERLRMGDRLRVKRAVSSETRNLEIPAFMVQTLVENAVQHGLSRRPEGGELVIACSKTNGRLDITVADSGPGIPALFGQGEAEGRSPFFGFGLSNVTDRLERLYGEKGTLAVHSDPVDGTEFRLSLPC